MKKSLILLILVAAGLVVYLHASVKQGYQTATVVTVKKLDTTPQFIGGNPTDAPVQAEEYAYEIGFRLECTNYVGRYESGSITCLLRLPPIKRSTCVWRSSGCT